MKINDITEAIVNSVENKLYNEWRREGYIDGYSAEKAYAVVDGKKNTASQYMR